MLLKLAPFLFSCGLALNVTETKTVLPRNWILRNDTVYSTSSNSSYSRAYFTKHRSSIEKGRSLCPRSGNFNPDPNGPAQSFDGVYFEDDGAVGKLVDYQKCVYIVSTVLLGWSDAQNSCKANVVGGCGITCPGSLVTIHSLKTNDKVAQAVYDDPSGNSGSPYWIGARQHCTSCPFEWTDHSPFDYAFWAPGEPNNWGNGEDCVEMTLWDKTWNDDNCNTAFPFICQSYLEESHPLPSGDENWPATGNCKEGWVKYARACYRIVGDSLSDPDRLYVGTWSQANAQCASEGPNLPGWTGATLAILPNIHYQYFITALAKNNGRTLWLGGLSTTQDTTFHWVDNSRLTFTNWLPGEPNASPDEVENPEDYLEMLWWPGENPFGKYPPGCWNDLYETQELASVCSHKLDYSLPEPPKADNCPSGWISATGITGAGSFCYKMIENQDTDFDGAQAYCEGLKDTTGHTTNLASIEDAYENNLVTSLFYHAEKGFNPSTQTLYAWVGFYSSKDDDGTTRWRWTDGAPTAYTQWALGEPNANHISSTRSCVYIDQALNWHVDTQCNAKIPFVCKSNTDEIDLRPTVDERGDLIDCDRTFGADWYSDGNGYYCLKAFEKETDWYEAEHICKYSSGGHLASIHNEGYNQRIRSLATNTFGTKKYWIGMTRNSVGGFQYSDGSPVTYQPWHPGEPSGEWNGQAEDCVDVWDTGLWNDESCSTIRPFVCKVHKQMENCVATADLDKEMCGYPGITESECISTMKCCYSSYSPITCFKPGGKTKTGMTPAAAGLTASVVWAFIAVLVIIYFVKGS